ncbi:MAG: O-sialoglycoprotein endopeptidase [Christensenellales bacterium]
METLYAGVFGGQTVAHSIACALDVPLHTFSHQQGHLRAAEINCPMPDEYLGVHLSGGTTEILRVQTEKYSADILGGTEDIAAGQWVDRAGVAMELHFPAGPEMEALAQQTEEAHLFTVAVKGTKLYFSGAETQTKRAIIEGVPRCEIARGVFVSLGRALAKAVLAVYEQTGLLDVLIAGGVSANELVKQQLRLVCAKKAPALRLHFADPQYAGDNAAGIALLAKEAGC